MDFFFCYSPTWDKNLEVLVCRIFLSRPGFPPGFFICFESPFLLSCGKEIRSLGNVGIYTWMYDIWLFFLSTTVNTQLPKVIEFYQTDSPSQESTGKTAPSMNSLEEKVTVQNPCLEKILKAFREKKIKHLASKSIGLKKKIKLLTIFFRKSAVKTSLKKR